MRRTSHASFLVLALTFWAAQAAAQFMPPGLGWSSATTYTGPGDIVSFTSWVSAGRAYKGSIAGTQKLVNVTSTANSDTCDVLSAANGGTGLTANCGGAHNGESATTFCTSVTDCVVNTGYDQSGAAGSPGNYTQSGGETVTVKWNPTGLNGLPCFQVTADAHLVSASTVTPATGTVSMSAVAKETTTSPGSSDWLLNENATHNLLEYAPGPVTGITDGSGSITKSTTFPSSHAINGVIHGASSSLSVDGVLATPSSITGSTATATAAIGFNGGSGSTDVTCIGEVGYIDNVDFATSEAALHTNQSAFWGTP